jgi:hypothetical protein
MGRCACTCDDRIRELELEVELLRHEKVQDVKHYTKRIEELNLALKPVSM